MSDEDRESWEGHIDYSRTTQRTPRKSYDVDIVEDDVYAVEPEEDAEAFGGVRAPRGPKKFTYTYQTLSEATGLTVRALQQRAHKKEFIPEDYMSTLRFVVKMINKRAKK